MTGRFGPYWCSLAVVLAGCSSQKQRATEQPMPAACEIATRAIDRYMECRRANASPVFRAEHLVEYRSEMVALWRKVAVESGPLKAARMCSYQLDRLRTDMAGENCVFAMTDADRTIIADARVPLTPAPHASNAENQSILDARAAHRDRTCKCADQACVDAVNRENEALPLEKLQIENEAVHKAFDAISIESYDCATHPAILSPERWRAVQ